MPKGKESNISFLMSSPITKNSLANFSFRTDVLMNVIEANKSKVQESPLLQELEEKAKKELEIYLKLEKSKSLKTTTERKKDLKLIAEASRQLIGRLIEAKPRMRNILHTTNKLLNLINKNKHGIVQTYITIVHFNLSDNRSPRSFYYKVESDLLQLRNDLKFKKSRNTSIVLNLQLLVRCCEESIKHVNSKKYSYQCEELIYVLSKLWTVYTNISPHTRYINISTKFKKIGDDYVNELKSLGHMSEDDDEPCYFSIFCIWVMSILRNLENLMHTNDINITRWKLEGVLIEVKRFSVKK